MFFSRFIKERNNVNLAHVINLYNFSFAQVTNQDKFFSFAQVTNQDKFLLFSFIY